MKTRCYNQNSKDYARYGGRGIRVCKRWVTFMGFYNDMARSYKEGLSLDRIDPNGHYAPSNCRWATPKEQSRNRRNSIIVDGKPLKQLAEETGISYSALVSRYAAGDRGARLTRPVDVSRRSKK
jgi:hypothetical protein